MAEPEMLDVALEGDAPAHFVPHGGRIAAFFDGDGSAQVFSADDLGNEELEQVEVSTGAPAPRPRRALRGPLPRQHPHTDPDALPLGVAVQDGEGHVVEEFRECPELHGETSSGDVVGFACADGILLVTPDGDGAAFDKIAYPEGEAGPEGERRAYSLLGAEGVDFFAGFLTTGTSMVRLDLDSATMTELPKPADNSPVALNPAGGGAILTVTADGTLHTLDPGSGEVTASLPVVEPFSLEGGFGVPRPQIAIALDTAYVSDPSAGTVVEVALDDLRVVRTLEIGGTPTSLVVLGPPS